MTVKELLETLDRDIKVFIHFKTDTRDIYQIDKPTEVCKLSYLQIKQFENEEVRKIEMAKSPYCEERVLNITYVIN